MRITADRIALLLSYGLSEYQAKAYLALLEYPSCSAGDLAKVSSLPRNRLYDVLADLQELGLAQINLEEGKRKYRANPLSSFLDRQVERLRERINDIESRKGVLAAAFRPPPQEDEANLETGTTQVLLGRRSVAREIERLVENAEERVLLVASAGGVERAVGYLRNSLRTGGNGDKPEVSLVIPRGVSAEAALDPVSHLITGSVRRARVRFRTSTIIVDDSEMLIVQPIPDDARLSMGEDFALLTTNPALIHDRFRLITESVDGSPEEEKST